VFSEVSQSFVDCLRSFEGDSDSSNFYRTFLTMSIFVISHSLNVTYFVCLDNNKIVFLLCMDHFTGIMDHFIGIISIYRNNFNLYPTKKNL